METVDKKEWQFTDEDKKSIEKILKKIASKDQIEFFIRELESVCHIKMLILKQPKPLDVRLNRKDVLRSCKKALKDLNKVIDGGTRIMRLENLNGFYGPGAKTPNDLASDFMDESYSDALNSVGPLEKFIKTLEKYHLAEKKKIGRVIADSDHFIKNIRDIYEENIGKPSTYEDGPFFSLVQTVLEILGLPFKDPSRLIRNVLSD